MNQSPVPFARLAGPAGQVGIDVSKDRLDVAMLPSGKSWSTANQELTALMTRRRQLMGMLVAEKISHW